MILQSYRLKDRSFNPLLKLSGEYPRGCCLHRRRAFPHNRACPAKELWRRHCVSAIVKLPPGAIADGHGEERLRKGLHLHRPSRHHNNRKRPFNLASVLALMIGGLAMSTPAQSDGKRGYGEPCAGTSDCAGNLSCHYTQVPHPQRITHIFQECWCPEPKDAGYSTKNGRPVCWGPGVPAHLVNK
jgi:hypothetical protein